MHDSVNDLLHDTLDIDYAFMCGIEELAAELEVTVDYYMAEFM